MVAIHHAAFKEFFLTGLGLGFLQTYYKVVLNSGLSIAVCAVDENNEILGFSTGSKTRGGYHSKILMSGFFLFILQGLRLLFTRPVALFRLTKNLNKRPHPDDTGDYSELLAIAVLPQAKGLGVGKGLLSAYEKEALNAGFKRVALTTDFNNNDAVVAFYKKCGYEIYYDFITYPNRHMYKMIKIL
ncbi:MAG: GNAT family N-acetyltransferase [Bacteroidales bacterium]|nr:GNAT family N-acetyltransferase [Bacteroidales bacterium]